MRKSSQCLNNHQPIKIVQVETVLQNDNGKQIERIHIDRYKYSESECLGQGFSSKVYKATLISDKRERFAIKVIDLKRFKDDQLELLDGEVNIIKGLNHPNIIKCEDVFRDKEHFYLVTQYCPHGDLQGLIAQQKQICEDVAIKIIEQVISAYRYMLSRKILHRDLKPANIMRFGKVWKIGDFGFSRHCPGQFVLEQINLGTPLYMPLQCLQLNKYSYKSDLFALGVIFFEMLIGSTPWPGSTRRQLVRMIKQCQQIPLPQSLQCPDVKNFLMRTLAIDYYDRMTKDQFNKVSFSQSDLNKVTQKRNRSHASCKRTVSSSVHKSQISQLLTPGKQFKSSKMTAFSSQKLLSTQKSIATPNRMQQKNRLQIPNQYMKQHNSFAIIRIFHENAEIIRNEIQFCMLLAAMAQNIQNLHLCIPTQTYLISLLCSFIVRDLTMLTNPKLNVLKLSNWDTFRKSDIFKQCQEQIQKSLSKYKAWELDFNLKLDSVTARRMQQEFPEFMIDAVINYKFYARFCAGIKDIVRNDVLVAAQNIDAESKRGFNNGISQLIQILKIIQYRSSKTNEKKGFGLTAKPEIIGNYCRPSNRLIVDYRTLSLEDNLAILASRIELPN